MAGAVEEQSDTSLGTAASAPKPQQGEPASSGPAAGEPAAAGARGEEPPGFIARGRARRRARFLRKARELAYRDLGGLVFNLHRFGQRNDPLVLAKLTTLGHLDSELRALEDTLDEHQPITVLSEAGITACARCAAIHSSEDRFCPNCGLPLYRHADLPADLGTATVAPPATALQPPATAVQPSTPAPVPAGAPGAAPSAMPPPTQVEPAAPPAPDASAQDEGSGDEATAIIRPSVKRP